MTKTVRDVMTPVNRLAILDSTASVAQAQSQMTVLNVNSILVKPYKGSRTWRVFTSSDFLIAIQSGENPKNLPLSDFSTGYPNSVTPDTTLKDCLENMVTAGEQHCLVIDRNGDVVGMISTHDILAIQTSNLNGEFSTMRQEGSRKGIPTTVNKGEMERKLKVFLCHASDDKPAVKQIYQKLKRASFDPWLDEEKLLPGQDWHQEIRKAVKTSDIIIVFFSQKSINKSGFVQKEIKYALDIADEQPEGKIFLIPFRLEECEIPERVQRWQWVDGFTEIGQRKLIKVLRNHANALKIKLSP